MNKKLQVFVSSTYTDLIEERQAAVQAILDAGHIPAGMELFKAGNESQLKTIYKWIDESDVYMLILGGHYGSIEEKSGKSYTQLEYEYALSKNIPVFAVVLSESFLTMKINLFGLSDIMEQKTPDKYQVFRSLVMSKIIRMVDDCKDIKITIHSTLNEFINEYDLIGWIRNSKEKDTLQLLKDNTNLLKENNSLKKQIQKLQEQINAKSKEQFGNYSFDELVNILNLRIFHYSNKSSNGLSKIIKTNALDYFTSKFDIFCDTSKQNGQYLNPNICILLQAYDLIEKEENYFVPTKIGVLFYEFIRKKTSC